MTNWSSHFRARLVVGGCAVLGAAVLGLALLKVATPVAFSFDLTIAVLGGAVLLLSLTALVNLNRSSRTLKTLAETCRAVSNGDFEARITHIRDTGELGTLQHEVNELVDRIDAFVREAAASMDYVSRNRYFRRIVEGGMRGGFLNSARSINAATSAIEKRVDDFGQVTGNFEGKVEAIVGKVAEAAHALDVTARGMEKTATGTAELATNVAAAAEEASVNVQTVASAAERLSTSIADISSQVSRSHAVATSASDDMQEARGKITNLDESATKIGEVIDLISEIAEQTNLLALNATIESARAGEAGKGFAIVAQEVKNLANQTAEATEQISGQVAAVQAATSDAVGSFDVVSQSVGEVKEIADSISQSISEQTVATQEIANSVQQASEGASEVTFNIEKVTMAADKTSGGAGHVLEASQNLTGDSGELRGLVKHFLGEVHKVV